MAENKKKLSKRAVEEIYAAKTYDHTPDIILTKVYKNNNKPTVEQMHELALYFFKQGLLMGGIKITKE